MEKSKKYYWAVFENGKELFEGSFSDCWKWLVKSFSGYTLAALEMRGIRIGRKA